MDNKITAIEEARLLLMADTEQRIKACEAEVEEVLKRHGMTFIISQPKLSVVPIVPPITPR